MPNNLEIKLPDVGEGVTEAEIVGWHVNVGDSIEEDQPIVEVMTDKVTIEMPSPSAGMIVELIGEVGDVVAVGSVIARLSVDGSSLSASVPKPKAEMPKKAESANTHQKSTVPVAISNQQTLFSPSQPTPNLAITSGPNIDPLAAPATRRRAYELGIPLQFVAATGAGGRVTMSDLDAHIANGNKLNSDLSYGIRTGGNIRTGITETKIVGMRRKIAERMQLAKSKIPHFSYVEEFDLTELEELRKGINSDRKDDQPKLTLLPFFMRAVALLQEENPHINARYNDEKNTLSSYEAVHVGIATQTDNGLVVPVVRNVEARDVWSCAQELVRVTTAAREGTATRDDLSGSTITLTSLGVMGGIAATPVINSPEVAIIGPNKLVERPVVKNGQIVVRTLMNVSSSFDHRIVDGYDAAKYIQSLKRLIETPTYLFMESFK